MDTHDPHGDVGPTPLSFHTPETRFGAGVSEELPSVLDRLTVDRPLVVTDAGVREAGIVDRVAWDVEDAVFHDATTEPSNPSRPAISSARSYVPAQASRYRPPGVRSHPSASIAFRRHARSMLRLRTWFRRS